MKRRVIIGNNGFTSMFDPIGFEVLPKIINCRVCYKSKSFNDYHSSNLKTYDYECKDCYSKNKKENPERDWIWRLKQYGLTLDDYKALLQKQNGVCKICKRKELKRRLSVDHD